VLPTEEQPVTEWHEVGGSQMIPPVLIAVSPGGNPNRDYIDIFSTMAHLGIWALAMSRTIYHLAGKIGQAVRIDLLNYFP